MSREVKRRKKFSLKKIKRACLKLVNNIVEKFKKIIEMISNLSLKVKIIIGIWLVILILISIMIFAGNANKKFLAEYSEVENKMSEAMLKYVSDNEIFPTESQPLKLSIDALVDFKHLSSDVLGDKVCIGYSTAYYNDIEEKYEVSSYLNCNNYTTDGYVDNK